MGSCDESTAHAGATHYLEHLLFKGTRRRTALEISAAMDAVGGELNAFTGNGSGSAQSQAVSQQEKAARTGFDWPDAAGPLAKLEEEIREARECGLHVAPDGSLVRSGATSEA